MARDLKKLLADGESKESLASALQMASELRASDDRGRAQIAALRTELEAELQEFTKQQGSLF